eukprot:3471436-Rhodomonas_salina.2
MRRRLGNRTALSRPLLLLARTPALRSTIRIVSTRDRVVWQLHQYTGLVASYSVPGTAGTFVPDTA